MRIICITDNARIGKTFQIVNVMVLKISLKKYQNSSILVKHWKDPQFYEKRFIFKHNKVIVFILIFYLKVILQYCIACASYYARFFASLERENERVHKHNERNFPQARLDNEINVPFL